MDPYPGPNPDPTPSESRLAAAQTQWRYYEPKGQFLADNWQPLYDATQTFLAGVNPADPTYQPLADASTYLLYRGQDFQAAWDENRPVVSTSLAAWDSYSTGDWQADVLARLGLLAFTIMRLQLHYDSAKALYLAAGGEPLAGW